MMQGRVSHTMTPGRRNARIVVKFRKLTTIAPTELGMGEAFDPARTDFSQMAKVNSGNRVVISSVKHRVSAS